jgi:hypothetical protein
MRELDEPAREPHAVSLSLTPSMRLGQDASGGDAHLVHHQQPELPHEQVASGLVGDVVTRDVQPEPLALEATAVEERDLEVDLDPMLRVRHSA